MKRRLAESAKKKRWRLQPYLAVEHVEFYRQPDGGLRVNRPLVSRLAQRIRDCKPSTIYVPHAAEQHPDHRVVVKLLQRSLRLLDLDEPPRVLAYEVWTPLQQLDEIVDITPYMETKLRAIAAYSSQTRVMNFAAAAQGLARYRGEMHCWPGGEFAEVFADLSESCRDRFKNNEFSTCNEERRSSQHRAAAGERHYQQLQLRRLLKPSN